MEEQKLNDLLDALVLKTNTQENFTSMSEIQRAISALQVLITTTTRSGSEVFFEPEYNFLWADASNGLKLIGVDRYYKCYNDILKAKDDRKDFTDSLIELQEGIVEKDFELLYTSILNFVSKEFINLSKNI